MERKSLMSYLAKKIIEIKFNEKDARVQYAPVFVIDDYMCQFVHHFREFRWIWYHFFDGRTSPSLSGFICIKI